MKHDIPPGETPSGERGASTLRILLGVVGLPSVIGTVIAFGSTSRLIGLGLAVGGGLILLIGGIFRLSWRSTLYSDHASVWSTPLPERTVRLDDVSPGSLAAVSGHINHRDGEIESPLTGRAGAFVRVEICSYVTPRGSGGSFRGHHCDEQGAPLWISDGSAAELQLGGSLVVDVERNASTRQYDADAIDSFSAPIRRYIRAQKNVARDLRLSSHIRVYETVAKQGDLVTVVGSFHRAGQDPYRGDERPVVRPDVLSFAFLGTLEELRAHLTRGARRQRLLSAIVVAGLVAFLVGVALTIR